MVNWLIAYYRHFRSEFINDRIVPVPEPLAAAWLTVHCPIITTVSFLHFFAINVWNCWLVPECTKWRNFCTVRFCSLDTLMYDHCQKSIPLLVISWIVPESTIVKGHLHHSYRIMCTDRPGRTMAPALPLLQSSQPPIHEMFTSGCLLVFIYWLHFKFKLDVV